MILGRKWLETADTFIGCSSGCMTISYGYTTKNIALCPPAKPIFKPKNPLELEFELAEVDARLVLTISKAFQFKNET